MATTTNYSWTTPDDTALVKDGASAIRSLGTAIDTTTKALNPSTTLGDIEYRSSTANTNTRLAIGSTGNVLTVAGGVPTWAAPAASGGMTLIQETVANGNSSISFGSIPNTYKQLLLVFSGLYQTSSGTAFSIRLNNSSASEYNSQTWGFNNSTPTIQCVSAVSTNLYIPTGVFGEEATSQTTYETATGNILIDNYASTTKHKTYYGFRAYKFNAGAGEKQYHSVVGSWANTSAITSLDVVRTQGSGNITNISNTSIRLYGIS